MSKEPTSAPGQSGEDSHESRGQSPSKHAFLKSPLALAFATAILALGGGIARDLWSESLKQSQAALDENARQFQGRLIQAAIEHDDPNKVIAKLQLLKELDLVPAYREQITNFLSVDTNAQKVARSLSDEDFKKYQAALIERVVGSDDLEKIKAKFQMLNDAELLPQYSDRLKKILIQRAAAAAAGGTPPNSLGPALPGPKPDGTTASATVNAEPASHCSAMKSTPEAGDDGWIFLGQMNPTKTAWVPSSSGTRSIRFDDSAPANGDIAGKLKGQCFHTLIPKYLREDAPPGEKVRAAVKRALPAHTYLRILEVDDTGLEKDRGSNPVIWARVETLLKERP